MMDFEPIAIIGVGCVFPGVFTPDDLWAGLLRQQDFLSTATEADWGLSERAIKKWRATNPWETRGGYIRGFSDVFDPTQFHLPTDELAKADPLIQWTLYAARQAFISAGIDPSVNSDRAGAILGNLSLPTRGMSAFAESVWTGQIEQALGHQGFSKLAIQQSVNPIERFMSGRPAHELARAFGLGAGAMALDAACASSLYAIRLACDWLHQGRADVMLAGAVNGADPLFLHTGFRVLKASSQSGQSRPFHQQADGLVPSEGVGMVVLKRLADAVASGDKILAVIRAVGLSNDGGSRGFLVPSQSGQVDAMTRAYDMCGVRPEDISFIECHATGTALGDATELASMKQVFQRANGIHIGSSKSNLGHLVTASGMASLTKVLFGLKHHQLPPNLHVDNPLAEAMATPFHLLTEETKWVSDRPRFAAVSSFGFGGNNAHLVVEEWANQTYARVPSISSSVPPAMSSTLAIVGIGVVSGSARGKMQFVDRLMGGRGDAARNAEPFSTKTEQVYLDPADLRYPPRDLEASLPQQLLLLEAAREAMAEVTLDDTQRVGVIAGMQCDAEIVKHIAALRADDWVERWNQRAGTLVSLLSSDLLSSAFYQPLTAAGVVGLLPNMVANRLNHFFRVTGPGFSVSSEELSGIDALNEASGLLRRGEIDVAMVGASDLSCELVHAQALKRVFGRDNPGDTAIVLVVKRLENARQAGDTVYALLPGAVSTKAASATFGDHPGAINLASLFGDAHTATGLLQVAAAALSCYYRVRLGERHKQSVQPWLDGSTPIATVSMQSLPGMRSSICLTCDEANHPAPLVADIVPHLYIYAASNRKQVLDLAESHRTTTAGTCRLVVVALDERERAQKCSAAIAQLGQGQPVQGVLRLAEGVYYTEGGVGGELAFLFTGAAAAYPGMGNALLLAYPNIAGGLLQSDETQASIDWAYSQPAGQPTALNRIVATSFLSRFHAELSRTVLKLNPQAVIGLSAGETNALLSMGAWRDADAVYRDFRSSDLFNGVLSSPYQVLQTAWSDCTAEWASWRMLAPVEQVRALVAVEKQVYVTLIHSETDCVISGHPDACNRVIQQIGGHRAISMGFDLVVHCPEVQKVHDAWRELHHRPTYEVPGTRFYTSSTYRAYAPDADDCADALTDMATHQVDFPRLIETAWADGVRVFVEHGPRNLCATWVRQILGDRPHVVVSLDNTADPSIHHFVDVVAQLVASGYEFDHQAVLDGLRSVSILQTAEQVRDVYQFAAHPPVWNFPALPEEAILLPLPPNVAPIRDLRSQEEVPTRLVPSEPAVSATADGANTLAQLTMTHQQTMAAAYGVYLAKQSGTHQQFLQRVLSAEEALLHAISAELVASRAESIAPIFVASFMEEVGAQTESETVNDDTMGADAWVQAQLVLGKRQHPTGPTFSRNQLEVLASEKISTVFGTLFEQQDGFARQVRMPEPPLLLADRVLGIKGTPGSMGTGTIWTETDVTEEAWYLHDGYMPFGILVESGQADLLLISWLGADFLNRNERVYRLLGCEMTFHGRLPAPGDTLHYEIHIDGHAKHGDVRLFFFRYDCYVNGEKCLTMRNGQAGFFTDEELRESKGVIWRPEDIEIQLDARVDAPAIRCGYRAFSPEQVERFAQGDVKGCFGPGFELAATHVRTPRIPKGMMQLIHQVTVFDPAGGPWGRGYLRAETPLTGDEWYFPCHFKGDPAMPGTLMMEGCLQSISFYMTAMGFTLDKDGYRFEIVPEQPYKAVCRGQATPDSRNLVYEIFVEEVVGGSSPVVAADVLVTVDGLKAFHCRRMGVRLVPDWPLTSRRQLLRNRNDARPVATAGDFRFDYASLLACAWGKPSDAFGPMYKVFDGTRRLPRLPGPPYHFMSRVTRVDAEPGAVRPGMTIEVEYDIPPDAWYFDANGTATMPYCVLLEAALQPCGWLTAFAGIPLQCDMDLAFRNLDGTGTLYGELDRQAGVLVTRVEFVNVSRMGNTFIETFAVECYQGGTLVYRMNTVFGHFPKAELLQQVGLPVSEPEQALWDRPSSYSVDLLQRPAQFFEGKLRLPEPSLLMLDRITGYWQDSEGRPVCFRAEKAVNPDDWFFKAHFFQDPVQPGSLGIEAMIQLLQAAMIEMGLGSDMQNPRFEPIRLEEPMSWKYRGQVLPQHNLIVTHVELVEIERVENSVYVVANAALVVDGQKIYSVERLGMGIVDGSAEGVVQA